MTPGARNEILDASANGRDPASTLLETAWGIIATEPERAHTLADEALALATDETRSLCALRHAVVVASLAHGRSEFVDALAMLDSANAALETDDAWCARLLNSRGICHDGLSQFAVALESFQWALEIYERLNDASGIAKVVASIGDAHARLGNFSHALVSFQRAHAIHEARDESHGIIEMLGRIGWVHHEMDDATTALRYFTESLVMAEDLRDEKLIGIALSDASTAYSKLGDHRTALDHIERSLAICRKRGQAPNIGVALINAAIEHKNLGNFDAAREAYAEGLTIHEQLGARSNVAAVHGNIGILEYTAGNLDTALHHLNRSIEIAEEIGVRPLAMAIHYQLALVNRDLDNNREAFDHLTKHFAIEREIRTDETRRKLQDLESTRELELARKEAEIERLRNVELAESNSALRSAHEALASAHNNLKSAQSQLVHAEKMASLGLLTAGIAHEINNPINFIRASAGPLRRDLDEVRDIIARALQLLPDDVRTTVEQAMQQEGVDEVRSEIDSLLHGIEDGATRTAEIVKGLRSFSRLGEDAVKVADLHEGIDSTLVLLGSKIRNGIVVRREFGEIPGVECLPGQINQVLMNIIANAIDAVSTEGPALRASAEGPKDQSAGGVITVRTSCVDSFVRVAISDNGPGIDDANLPRIFEPFFTTKPVGKGQGLGLSISHGIVERHGGAILVESTATTGTTFTVVLPIAANIS